MKTKEAEFGVPFLIFYLSFVSLMGCARVPQGDIPVRAEPQKATITDESLKTQLDDVLQFTWERRLDTETQAAWQVLHGCLAYGTEFEVTSNGKDVKAIDYLLNGGNLAGWTFQPGTLFESDQRRGLRAVLDPGAKKGQGHVDQWLGYLSSARLPLETEMTLEGQTYVLGDVLREAEWEVSRNPNQEYSWTLMALAAYRPPNYAWRAVDGREWSVQQLVQLELEQDIDSSPCGGTHRLVGLTTIYNHHVRMKAADDPIWSEVKAKLDDCIVKARKNQGQDGVLSANFFERPGSSADLALAIHAAGHTFEFLAMACDDEQLREPWMQAAAASLCKLYRKTRSVRVECGALYHGARGLRVYRERVYGPGKFSQSSESDAAAGA